MAVDETPVGPVRFLDRNASPIADCTYTAPNYLRPFQICFQGRWYEQNQRVTRGGARWNYKEVPSGTGVPRDDLPLDPYISTVQLLDASKFDENGDPIPEK